MAISFDPKSNKTPNLIKNVYLARKDDKTLVQRPKEPRTGLWKFLNKVIHWIFHPSEHISGVRDVFNRELSQRSGGIETDANLYANCRLFNCEVIQKHNKSWISFFLFWNRVPLLDAKRLDALEKSLKQPLADKLETLSYYYPSTKIERVELLCRTSRLLTETFALKETSLSSIYIDLQTIYNGHCERLGQEITKNLEDISKAEDLNEATVKAISTLAKMKRENTLPPEVIPFTGQLESLALQESDAQSKLEQLRQKLALKQECSNEFCAVLEHKFIPTEQKEDVRKAQAEREWEDKVAALNAKVMKAKSDQIVALRKEAKQLESERPKWCWQTPLTNVYAKLDILEKVDTISAKWQQLNAQTYVTAQVRDLEATTLGICKNQPDMSNHPSVETLHLLVKATLARIQVCEQGCSQWRGYFNNHTQSLRTHAKNAHIKMEETFSEEKDFDRFMKDLPEGDQKAELTKQAAEYKALLAQVKPFKEAMHKVKALSATSHPFTLNEFFDKIDALSRAYTGETFRVEFQAEIQSLRGRAFEKLIKHINDEGSLVSSSQTILSLEQTCKRRTDWTKMKTLLEQSSIGNQDPRIKTAQAMVVRLLSIASAFDAFQKEYHSYHTHKNSDPSSTVFEPGTGVLPPLVNELGMEHPISKLYLRMIFAEYLRVKVIPRLDEWSIAINVTDGSNLDQLAQDKVVLKREIDRIVPREEFCKSSWDVIYLKYLDIEKKLEELTRLNTLWVEFQDLLKKGKPAHEIIRRTDELCSIFRESSLVTTHTLVQAMYQTAQAMNADYTSMQSLVKKVDAYALETEAGFEALCKDEKALKELETSLKALRAKYPDEADLGATEAKLARLKDIVIAYPKFRAHAEAVGKEITARNEAADRLGVIDSSLQAPDGQPALVAILGEKHFLIHPFLVSAKRVTQLRSLVQGIQELQPKLQGDIGAQKPEEKEQLAAKIYELDNLSKCVDLVALKLVEKYEGMVEKQRQAIEGVMKVRQAYHNESQALLKVLNQMIDHPEANKKQISLAFFTASKGQESLYARVQKLKAHPLVTKQDLQTIEQALRCFPEIFFKDIAFVQKCANTWKSSDVPAFTEDDVRKLQDFIKTPKQPLQLALQFELLLKMHLLKFNPRERCSISMTPLIDPVVTRTNPVRYYNHEALEKWLNTNPTDPFTRAPMTMDHVDRKPELGALVQDWLLCKDIIQRQPGVNPFPMLTAFVKACPAALRPALQHCIATRNTMTNDSPTAHLFIKSLLERWVLNRDRAQFVLQTNELAWNAASPSKDMPTYVAQLHQLTENLAFLNRNFRVKLGRENTLKDHIKNLEGYTQLLRILLSQPNAFIMQNFEETQKLVQRMMSFAYPALSTLIHEYGDQPFDGPIPPGADTTPPAAVQLLLVRVYVRNTSRDVRSTQSIDEHTNYIRRVVEQQRLTWIQTIQKVVAELTAKVQEIVRQIQTALEVQRQHQLRLEAQRLEAQRIEAEQKLQKEQVRYAYAYH